MNIVIALVLAVIFIVGLIGGSQNKHPLFRTIGTAMAITSTVIILMALVVGIGTNVIRVLS
jgi:hypothetical protein